MKSTSLLAATLTAAVAAGAATAEPSRIFDGVRMAGSERLALFALTRPGLPIGAMREAYGLAQAMGQEGAAPGTVIHQRYDVAPILRYDDNLNGGMKNDSFTVLGLEFRIDEEQVAKEGLLIGAEVSSDTRVALGYKTALDVDLGAWAGVSPGNDLSKVGANGQACVSHRIDFANHIQSCGGAAIDRYDLGEGSLAFVSADYIRLFQAGPGLHEARIGTGVNRNFTESGDYDQQTLSFGLTSAWKQGFATNLRMSLGEEVEGRHVTTKSVDAGVSAVVFDKATSFRAGWRESEGGLFLGEPRTDETWSVSVSRPVTKRVSLSVGYSDTNSTADFYDDHGVDLAVNFNF